MTSSVPQTAPSVGENTISWSQPSSPKTRTEYSPDELTPVPTVSEGLSDEPTWPREWQAYVTLMGCFFLMFNSWGLVNAYGTFSSYYKEDFLPGRDLLLLNLVGSTESFIVLINSWWIGRLLDSGHSRYIVFAGWILVSLGMFTLSLSSGGGDGDGNYALVWVTQGLTTGLGMACFFVASSQIAATWFVKRKSFAIGIVASGASIAGLVYPFMTKYLIADYGFSVAVRCVAGLVCGTAFLSWVCAVPNPLHPLNKSELPVLSVRRWIDPDAFRNATFNWFVASIAFMFFGFYAVFFNVEEWAVNKRLGARNPGLDTGTGNDTFHTFIYLAVMNASSTLGRLSSGYLSDKYGALKVHTIVMTIGSILLYAFWTTVSNIPAALAFVILFGAISGAIIGLPPASVAHIIKLSPDAEFSKLGQWTGMMYTVSAPFALTGPIIAGHLITTYKNNYLTVQMWSATCLFMSALCLAAAIWSSKRREASFTKTFSSATSIRNMLRGDTDEEKSVGFQSANPTAWNSQVFPRRPSDKDEID